MNSPQPSLHGNHVRLVPLEREHAGALAMAAAEDPAIYDWTFVPQGEQQTIRYIDTALAERDAGRAVPFAILRAGDEKVIGSTRFCELERWAWPSAHERHGSTAPDACEVGYTWFAASAIRTAANTEAKWLMLEFAFEQWQVLRVCLHTDVRNERSRRAMERIGARFEGILRGHRMAVDFIARDSARYSIVRPEWPAVKDHLQDLMQARGR